MHFFKARLVEMINSINISSFQNATYVYNLDILSDTIKEIKHTLKPFNVKLYYACKANNNYEILDFLQGTVDGVDVASVNELAKVKKFNFKNISINGPSFSKDDIRNIYSSEYTFDFNSNNQLKNCINFLSNKAIGIRLKYKTSRFGIDIETVDFDLLCSLNIKIERLHIHNESEDIGQWEELIKCAFVKLQRNNQIRNIKEINLGGGWSDSLFGERKVEFLEVLRDISLYINRHALNIGLIIEPGTAIVNTCAIFIGKILTVDEERVVINSSSHNINPWYSPIPIITTSHRQNAKKYTIYGNTCYEEDVFVRNVMLRELTPGQLIVFSNVGAYSKSNHSNLHLLNFPTELYYKNGRMIKK